MVERLQLNQTADPPQRTNIAVYTGRSRSNISLVLTLLPIGPAMLLLLVRHALAAERDTSKYPEDSERPLVQRGRKIQARISRALAKHGLVPTAVFSSPWKRAWQTAGILAKETGAGRKRRIPCPPLAQDPNLEAIARAIGARGTDEIVAVVGHEPWMSELAALLLSGSVGRPSINFPKSGVMAIKSESLGPGTGVLRFFLTPGTT